MADLQQCVPVFCREGSTDPEVAAPDPCVTVCDRGVNTDPDMAAPDLSGRPVYVIVKKLKVSGKGNTVYIGAQNTVHESPKRGKRRRKQEMSDYTQGVKRHKEEMQVPAENLPSERGSGHGVRCKASSSSPRPDGREELLSLGGPMAPPGLSGPEYIIVKKLEDRGYGNTIYIGTENYVYENPKGGKRTERVETSDYTQDVKDHKVYVGAENTVHEKPKRGKRTKRKKTSDDDDTQNSHQHKEEM
ncbi:hypothetical protein BaRGS_00013825 [Batillaria attramentaria]|uniref:Uncharacterized protein n=1 Tax=Batillaria attramentaria TaxID=370345 RepID=A0ABD0L6R5_9CAEN